MICHVHVGMPKTGTTSIQETFARLEKQPTVYLPYQNNNHSLLFATLFEPEPWRHKRYRYLGYKRHKVKEIREHKTGVLTRRIDNVARDPETTGIIFSGERLSQMIERSTEGMKRFKDFFSTWCTEFRIYGYVRPLGPLMPSDFQQRIRLNGNPDVDLDGFYPRYRKRFEKFDDLFGRENVSLRKFSRADLHNGNVVEDLAKQIGLDLGGCEQVHWNESLSREAVALYFAIRRSEINPDPQRDQALFGNKIEPVLQQIHGGRFGFHPDLVQDVIRKNQDDIAWIENRISATVTDPDVPNDRPIRSNQELLDLAREARPLLCQLSDLEPSHPRRTAVKDLLKWVDQGLARN